MSDAPSRGYGKWIRDHHSYSEWRPMPQGVPYCRVSDVREFATELLAWADAHDTVTLTMTKDEAKSLASILGDTNRAVMVAAHAARKALGMEP